MKEEFDKLFSSELMFEELRNGDVEISDSNYIFCTVEDCLAHDDGLALDRAKYIVKAVNMHHDMYTLLEYFASDSFEFFEGSEHLQYEIENILKKARK